MRSNAGCIAGNTVKITLQETKKAETIHVFILSEVPSNRISELEKFLCDELDGTYFVAGDIHTVLFLKKQVTFKVIKTVPSGAVHADSDTKHHIVGQISDV